MWYQAKDKLNNFNLTRQMSMVNINNCQQISFILKYLLATLDICIVHINLLEVYFLLGQQKKNVAQL